MGFNSIKSTIHLMIFGVLSDWKSQFYEQVKYEITICCLITFQYTNHKWYYDNLSQIFFVFCTFYSPTLCTAHLWFTSQVEIMLFAVKAFWLRRWIICHHIWYSQTTHIFTKYSSPSQCDASLCYLSILLFVYCANISIVILETFLIYNLKWNTVWFKCNTWIHYLIFRWWALKIVEC